MQNMVVNIIGEDDNISKVDEAGFPFIRRKYNVERALEASGAFHESQGHPNALVEASMTYECRFMPVFSRVFICQ